MPPSPLREPTYFILASLLDGPLHGYGIVKATDEASAGRVRLTAGTLYGALGRLTSEGLVAPDREVTVSGRTRRYYRITPAGTQALRAEAERLHQAATVVRTRLRIAGGLA